jgi:membrane protease YdiL (CAAX protease family)
MIIAYFSGGTQRLTALLHSLKKWRIPWFWYGFVIFFPSITMMITILIFNKTNKLFLDASFPLFHLNFSQILFLISILLYQLVIVWGEELGWRGYALPELQKKFSPIGASILLGLFWGVWHLPYFFMEGSAQENIPLWFFIISTIGYAIIYTFIFNGTNESAWMASLFHAANNTTVSFTMMFVPQIIGEPVITLLILLGFDLLIILLFGTDLYHLQRRNILTKWRKKHHEQ